MPQYLKDEVRARITGAALEAFAGAGFERATMAEIARRARISTGNLYRYFESKEALFAFVVPDSFVARFSELLGLRLQASDDVADFRSLAPGHPYLEASEALLDFTIRNRLRVVIVLGRAEGTRYSALATAVVERLVASALRKYRPEDAPLPGELHLVVREIYRNYVGSLAAILARLDRPEAIRAAVEGYQRYHLVGLKALLAS